MIGSRGKRLLAGAAVAVALAGCQTTSPDGVAAGTTVTTLESPVGPEGLPNDRALGKKHFRAQDFGLAELHFRRAVETNALDAEAWLGLAASYDHLRRFDLADRAYLRAIRLVGLSAEILNNRGYSFMLRGDLAKARKDLLAARARDPQNPMIHNNLRLLDNQIRSRR
jgi:Flp pilus assembly protein TadD